MVYRIYTAKKAEFANEEAALRNDARNFLGISRLRDVRIINRYDVEGIDAGTFYECIWKVFAEPQTEEAAGNLREILMSRAEETDRRDVIAGDAHGSADQAEADPASDLSGDEPAKADPTDPAAERPASVSASMTKSGPALSGSAAGMYGYASPWSERPSAAAYPSAEDPSAPADAADQQSADASSKAPKYNASTKASKDNAASDDEQKVKIPACTFAVELLPGHFDQRADSAEQCIQMISCGKRPKVSCARVYALYGELMPADIDAVKNYLINPAEAREISLEKPDTLAAERKTPAKAAVLEGFITMKESMFPSCISKMKLGMNEADLALCVEYFRDTEKRDPTITELRIIDAYWSESIRHTTMNTVIDSVTFEDPLLKKAYKDYLVLRKDLGRNMPVTLKDIATIAVRYLKREGRLEKLDESGDTNACTAMINVENNGENEPWLLMFSSGSNDQAAETEPFGGAAACIGGCIQEPLSVRAYAYAAMRLTGASDPLQAAAEAFPGRLPQRQITRAAADGASAYANNAGIAVGMADEIYHPGYAAKRMEVNAVMAAAPAVHVRREQPAPGDVVMLIGEPSAAGGETLQSGSASEERKIQRLFRNGVAARMIKRCSAVGAGGLSAAAGRLSDGIDIDLAALPREYESKDITALALAGSAECTACVIDSVNEKLFRLMAAEENLRCTKIADITDKNRLVIRRGRQKAADISLEFLRSNGAERHIDIAPAVPGKWQKTGMYKEVRSFTAAMNNLAQDLNVCSKQGISERFDPTAGATAVLMPFGGKNQLTPAQAMVSRIPLENGDTGDCSMIAWGYNPVLSDSSPYHGAYLAVVESVAKLIAAGSDLSGIYLMFHEYFGTPGEDPARWGRPLAAHLGAFKAQMDLGIGAVGGSESVDGSFEGLDVPPTLISFAVTMSRTGNIVSPEFKAAGHKVVILKPYPEENTKGSGRGLPTPESLLRLWEKASELIASGKAVSACTPGIGGMAEAVMKMSFGNGIGFRYDFDEEIIKRNGRAYKAIALEGMFGYSYGSIILELAEDIELKGSGFECGVMGYTTEEQEISFAGDSLTLSELLLPYGGRLESIFPVTADNRTGAVENISYKARSYHTPVYKRAEPKVLIPVFPGTNCEYESARAFREAGASAEVMVMRNRTPEEVKISAESFAKALKDAQIVFIPGGTSASGEPGGSAKLITAFFRNEAVREGVTKLLDDNDGLMCGICDGFQALIKLGLVPYGRITDITADSPTLTYNAIGSHKSGIARVRIASDKSPWLRGCSVGDVFSVPVSHGEGRFIAGTEEIRHLAGTGQIATQYADLDGNASADIRFNPAGSIMAVEGLISPDGRVIGRMGHPERIRSGLCKNVEGNYFVNMFENAVRYFK